MPDQEALVSEIKQLRKSRDRWRTVAIAALFLVFVVLLPFTVAVNELMERYTKPLPIVRPTPQPLWDK